MNYEKKNITLRLPVELVEALETLSKEFGISVSDFVILALVRKCFGIDFL